MDEEKITPEVLYGSSATPTTTPLPIEETPEIPMEASEEPQPSVPPPPPMPKVSSGSTALMIIVLIILFVAGMVISSYIRPFFSGRSATTTLPTPTAVPATPTPVDPVAGWKTSTIAGFSYKLPPDVLAPTCDGAGCISQGTYLPGGTRLTISPKTVTQSLSSLRGAVVTDVAGTAFTSHDATMSGHTVIEFTGAFTGRTSGGYGFSQMHGFMIEVNPTLTLEINHFTPTGVIADFDKDDTLFTQILSTLTFSSTPSATATQ